MLPLNTYITEIEHLAWCIPGFQKLSHHERQSAKNDTLIKFTKKIESGVVKDGENYDKYKNYLFITLKNTINKKFEDDETYNGKGRKNLYSIESEDFLEPIRLYQMQSNYKEVLASLNPKERAYIRFKINYGWPNNFLAVATDTPPSSMDKIIKRVLQKMKKKIIVY